jgi:hypothetical protein
VDRVIGARGKATGATRDGTIPESGAVDVGGRISPPGRYDDHYGFGRLSSFAY